jgi:heterodisulfide reductase subunit C
MQLQLDKSIDGFSDEFKKLSNINIYDCYQCGKCTAGCSIAGFMEDSPNRIIRFIQLNQSEKALHSKTPSLCAGCNTCTVRCPMDIDVAKVMETIRLMAGERGIASPEKEVSEFSKLFLRYVKAGGRLYELGMTAEFNLRTFNPFKDAMLGVKMVKKGKLAFLPEGVKDKTRLKRIFGKSGYFIKPDNSAN